MFLLFLYLLVGLMLSFAQPESREAQSIQANKKRLTVRQIDWGICPVRLQ